MLSSFSDKMRGGIYLICIFLKVILGKKEQTLKTLTKQFHIKLIIHSHLATNSNQTYGPQRVLKQAPHAFQGYGN